MKKDKPCRICYNAAMQKAESITPRPDSLPGLLVARPFIAEINRMVFEGRLLWPQNPESIQQTILSLPERVSAFHSIMENFNDRFSPETYPASIHERLKRIAEETNNMEAFRYGAEYTRQAAYAAIHYYPFDGITDAAIIEHGHLGFMNTLGQAAEWQAVAHTPMMEGLSNPYRLLIEIYNSGAFDASIHPIGDQDLFVFSFLKHTGKTVYWVEGSTHSSPFPPFELNAIHPNPVFAPGQTGLRLVK